MSPETNVLEQISQAIEARTAEAGRLVVAVRNTAHQHVSGIAWSADAVITSEQAVGGRDEYEIVNARGEVAKARIVGRDPGTNLLVLKAESALAAEAARTSAVARTGALALAFAADVDGASNARLGLVNAVGPQWYSRAGGRIEQRVDLDIRLARTEEGGPVLDASGALLGMSTLGSRGDVIVIPTATVERVVPQLLEYGQVPRGWLGLGLQPVAVPDALRDAAGQRTGMMVMSIVPDGPGANAGVTAGDILLTIDGVSLRRLRQLATQLDSDSIGRKLVLRLIRGGEIRELEVLISARPRS